MSIIQGGQTEFTYGEVLFHQFVALMNLAEPKPGEIFWDIGCGGAKPQAIAAFAFPFLKVCKGVELLDNLYQLAENAIKSVHTNVDIYNEKCQLDSKIFIPPIELIHGDILQTPWAPEADIVYISSVCFPEILIQKIGEQTKSLKRGARLITLQAFEEGSVPHLEMKYSLVIRMSWGQGYATIYVRK